MFEQIFTFTVITILAAKVEANINHNQNAESSAQVHNFVGSFSHAAEDKFEDVFIENLCKSVAIFNLGIFRNVKAVKNVFLITIAWITMEQEFSIFDQT
jgi:hypothetical protein